MKSLQEQELLSQVGQVREKLESLASDLRAVEDEIGSLAAERVHHELLDQACGALEKLTELGAASLFYEEKIEPARAARQLEAVRSRIRAFQAQLGELDARRRTILAEMGREEEGLEVLSEDLYQVREAEERRKLEWVVERDISPLPPRLQLMAWARGGEDDRLFRKSLALSLLASLILGLLFPMIRLPLTGRFEKEDAVPRRLAQFIRQEMSKPVPPPPAAEAKPPEREPAERKKPESAEAQEASRQPLPEETRSAAAPEPPPGQPGLPPGPVGPGTSADSPPGPLPRKAANAGILAFKNQIASLAMDAVAPRLGADARFGDADEASLGSMPTRSMLTTSAPGSSGGINIASLSRNVRGGGGGGSGGGGGGGIPGVEVGRATSSIASIGGEARPKASGGPGASRTDEEIQIVFDRYKSAFYRLYNRELRIDPTLQGQMVLRLTIEPDGSVSMCVLQSTDMDAPNLADQVVSRIRTIDFGAKEGVEALTIVYPIDFLPASDG
ncbi:MAG: AgmX/PglI C-terminal domain-containing protein [Anaerolineales bacterium]|nr:AgmX/PglI C-terminal domain-containing protein [Anaerolineales bacterium]